MPEKLMNIDPDWILGTADAGRLLGVSEREIRAKIRRGTLPAAKFGGKYYINIAACKLYESFVGQRRRKKPDVLCASEHKQPVCPLPPETVAEHFRKSQYPPASSDPFDMFWKEVTGQRFSFPYYR